MRTIFYIAIVIISSTVTGSKGSTLPHCDHKVYCQGEILNYVSRDRIFNDSKTFVDLKLKSTSSQTVSNFNDLLAATSNNPSKEQIQEFVSNNFEEGNELEYWIPPDFNPDPEFLQRIQNTTVRQFARDIVGIWPSLGRKVKDVVKENEDHYSLIPLPKGFIVPGGRFKEIYYWDTYWIVEGLLLSGMTETVKGILDNFASLVRRYGYIPNGSRIYYLDRTQPPFFTLMAQIYLERTKDLKWLKANIDVLDAELMHYINYKTVQVTVNKKKYTLAHYTSGSDNPRPESYGEDVATCSVYGSDKQKADCYHALKSGAESGWDFSSRWLFDEEGGTKANLSSIDTPRIIPTDLNSLLCKDFSVLKSLYLLMGNLTKAAFWLKKELAWKVAIRAVLYDEKDGVWYDYDTKLGKPRRYFYPTNLSPLALNIDKRALTKEGRCKAVEYLKLQGIDTFAGGVPTSLQKETGQQWDYPNAWPPLQDGIITALVDSGCPDGMKLAKELAQKWIESMIVGYHKDKAMYEKYDARAIGAGGGGGEYNVQTGFGWTNGAVLKLIDEFMTKKAR